MPTPMGNVKLNFDGCSLGNPGQLRIGGTLTDHNRSLVKAFPKNARVGLAIEVEISVLMKGLKLAKPEGLSSLLVEGDSTVVIYWANEERSSWQFDGWLHQIFDITLELGCSFCWIPWEANQVDDISARWGAKQLIPFVGDFLPP